mgnify:FL=1
MEKICGVDEAGRGPLAGPVVAAAVILPSHHNIDSIKDSKKLSEKKRQNLYDKIMDISDVSIGIVSNRTIDKINILNATYLAMEKAISGLDTIPDISLIDGYALPNKDIKSEGVIGGDDKVDCISAASIIAKVTRDEIMTKIDPIFPEFKFRDHKGYGTKYHMNTLSIQKATPIHRKSFRPVKKNLPSPSIIKDDKKATQLSIELVALYYLNNGYDIKEINKDCMNEVTLDIIAEKNKETIIVDVNKIDFYPSSADIKKIKTTIKDSLIDIKKESQISIHIANIDLIKNPIIEINKTIY